MHQVLKRINNKKCLWGKTRCTSSLVNTNYIFAAQPRSFYHQQTVPTKPAAAVFSTIQPSSQDMNLSDTLASIRALFPSLDGLLTSISNNDTKDIFHTLPQSQLGPILDEMFEAYDSDTRCKLPGEKPMNHLILLTTKYKDAERSLRLSQIMEDRGIKLTLSSINLLLDVLFDSGKCTDGLRIFHSLSDKEKSPVAYSLVLRGLTLNRRPRQALKIFSQSREQLLQMHTSVLQTFFTSLVKIGYFKDLKRIISCCFIGEWNVTLCNLLLRAFIANGKIWKACEFLEVMMGPKSSVKVDVTTFDILISGFLAKHDIKHSLILLNKMEEFQLRPTLAILSKFIAAYSDNGSIVEVMQVYDDLKGKYDLEPNLAIYSQMITACKRVGSISKATMIIDEMKARGIVPSVSILIETMSSFISSHKQEKAEEMFTNAMASDEWKQIERQTLFTGLLQAYMKHGSNIERIAELIKQAQTTNMRVTADTQCYNILVSAYCNINDVEGALNLFSQFTPDVNTFTILISAYTKQNKFTEAWNLLNKMRTEYNMKPSYSIYNILLAYYASADGHYDLERAKGVFNMMVQDKRQPSRTALEHLISGYLLKRDERSALEMYSVHEQQGIYPSYQTVKSFVNYYSKIKTTDGVVKYRKWMKRLRESYQ